MGLPALITFISTRWKPSLSPDLRIGYIRQRLILQACERVLYAIRIWLRNFCSLPEPSEAVTPSHPLITQTLRKELILKLFVLFVGIQPISGLLLHCLTFQKATETARLRPVKILTAASLFISSFKPLRVGPCTLTRTPSLACAMAPCRPNNWWRQLPRRG